MKQALKSASLVVLALIMSCMVLVSCGKDNGTTTEKMLYTEDTTLGQGATQFTFVCEHMDGKKVTFTINTDEKTVGAALLGVKLIEGEESSYGLYVKKVNGITQDYDVDQTYWSFYIDGEYASTGVDATNVESGKTYMFKAAK